MADERSKTAPTAVRFRRMGGFAAPAQATRREIDAASLDEAEAAELGRLLAAARESATAAEHADAPARAAPDQFYYEIEVDQDGDRTEIAFDDATISEAQSALVRWILEHS